MSHLSHTRGFSPHVPTAKKTTGGGSIAIERVGQHPKSYSHFTQAAGITSS